MTDFTPKKWDDAGVPDAATLGASDKLMGLVGSVVKRFPRSVIDAVYAGIVHATRHQHGGADEIATATPGANAIPKADAGGKLDTWVSDADASTKGKVKLAGQLGGTAALPDVRGVRETAGPTLLTLGAIADGQVLKRSGATVVGGTAGNVNPDNPPGSPDNADDEFEYGSGLDTTGARRASATAWSWVNQGSATATVASGQLLLASPASATTSLRMVVQAISGVSWKYRAKLLGHGGSVADTRHHGLVIRNSSSGKLIAFYKVIRTTGGPAIVVDRWNSATSISTSASAVTDIFTGGNSRGAASPFYFEVELSAGSLIFRYSDTGVDGSFITFFTEALATFVTSVDQLGLMDENANSVASFGVWDWFRKVA